MTPVSAYAPFSDPAMGARFAGTPVLDSLLPTLGGLTLPSAPALGTPEDDAFLRDLVEALTAEEE